jgi:hypothetical protein
MRYTLRANLMLLGAALAWGSTFVPCKIAAASLGTFFFNGLRFLLGGLFVLAMAGRRLRGLSRREVGGGALAGFVLFAGAAFQQAGLAFTTAGKAGFITGLYVVLVPLLLTLFWRQRSGWNAWVASLLASVGLFLLSAEGRLSLAPGDGLVLVSAALYGLHVILIGQWVGRMEPLRLAAMQYLACGLYSLALGLTLESPFLGSAPARRVDRSLHCRLLRCCGLHPPDAGPAGRAPHRRGRHPEPGIRLRRPVRRTVPGRTARSGPVGRRRTDAGRDGAGAGAGQAACRASPFVTPSIHKIASTKNAGVTRKIVL